MHAFKDGNQWVAFTSQRLPLADFEPVEGERNEFYVPAGWSDAEKLARFGLHVVTADAVPQGKRVTSETLIDANGAPRLARTFENLPDPPTPDSVSSRQFRLQLLADDLIDDVEAWVATQARSVQISYESSGSFVRSEPMMQAGFAALGFTEAQGDAFFIAAAKL